MAEIASRPGYWQNNEVTFAGRGEIQSRTINWHHPRRAGCDCIGFSAVLVLRREYERLKTVVSKKVAA